MTGSAAPARWRDLVSPVLASRAALVMLGVWLNAADALSYVPVAQLLKFISGAMSAEDFSALVVLIED